MKIPFLSRLFQTRASPNNSFWGSAYSFFFPPGRMLIRMHRQRCNCFRQYADAGIHCCSLQRRSFIDRFAARAGPKKEAVSAAPKAIFRTGPGWEKY